MTLVISKTTKKAALKCLSTILKVAFIGVGKPNHLPCRTISSPKMEMIWMRTENAQILDSLVVPKSLAKNNGIARHFVLSPLTLVINTRVWTMEDYWGIYYYILCCMFCNC